MSYGVLGLFSFLCLLSSDIISYINSFAGVSNGSTFIVLLLNTITASCLIAIISGVSWRSEAPRLGLTIFELMMFWSIISLIRGGYNAESYFEWKVLLLKCTYAVLAPLSIAVGLSYKIVAKILRFILRWVFPLSFAFVPVSFTYASEVYSRAVMPITLFILFIPFLSWRSRLLVLCVAILSVVIDPTYRMNLIKILFSFGLVGCFYLHNHVSRIVLNLVVIFMLLLPLLFLYLGVTDEFNIFRDGLKEGLNTDFTWSVLEGSAQRDSPINSDTRTFLYHEVFNSMLNRNSLFYLAREVARVTRLKRSRTTW